MVSRKQSPPTRVRIGLTIVLCLLSGSHLAGQKELTLGVAQESILEAGQTQQWIVEASASETLRLEIDQEGVDVRLKLAGPSGESLFEFDSTAPGQIEELFWLSEREGRYRIEIDGADENSAGVYRILWTTRRPSAPDDQLLARSFRLWLESLEPEAEGDLPRAMDLLKEALDLRHQVQGESLPLYPSLIRLGVLALNSGQFNEGQQYLHRALEIVQQHASEDSTRIAEVTQWLSLGHQAQGEMDRAIERMEESLRHKHSLYGADDPRLVQTLGGLAGMYYQIADYERALDCFRQCADLLRGGSQADPVLAMVLNNLAAVQETVGELSEAETTYLEALAIRRDLFGPEHEEVALTQNNLAFLYQRQGRYPEAEELLRQTSAIYESSLGPEHPDTARVWNNLAAVLKTQGKYEPAENYYRRAEALFRKALGDRHQETAGVLGNLSSLFMDQFRVSEARPLAEESLAILREAVGEHPLTANALNNLGELLRTQGAYRKARPLFAEALSILEKVFGEDHLELTAALNNLAGLNVAEGRLGEAEALFSRNARIQESFLGPEHPELGITYNNLGSVYSKQGRQSQAYDTLRQAEKIWRTAFGGEHRYTAVAAGNLAQELIELDRFEEAETLLSEALRIRLEVLGDAHPDVAISYSNRGDFHQRRHRLDQATRDFQAAFQIAQQSLDPGHPLRGRIESQVGQMLLATEDYSAARPRLRSAIQILESRQAYPESLVKSYAALARVENQLGRRAEAMSLLSKALELSARHLPQVGGSEETRAGLAERRSEDVALMIHWQVESGDLAGAFKTAERGRARTLLDQLNLSRVDWRAGIPESMRAELEQREEEAVARIAELQLRIRWLEEHPEESGQEGIAALGQALKDADQSYQQIYQELKSASRLWTEWITTRGTETDLATVQNQLLDDSTALLLYQLGEQSSYLFFVPGNDSPAQAWPLRIGEIEGLEIDPGWITHKKLLDILAVSSTDTIAHIVTRLGQLPDLSRLLHQMLIPENVWSRIQELEEVVIVPHGFLSFLPFDMLVTDLSDDAEVYWLDSGPAIRYVSSATILSHLQRAAPVTETHLLTVANPTSANRNQPGGPSSAGRPSNLPVLEGAVQESERIVQAFPDAEVLRHEDATEANLRNAIGRATDLHLATHGFVDSQRSSLFSGLALASSQMSWQDPSDDGFLQLHEIYQLDLQRVRLAVLSACETNIGNQVNNDGVFALSRGFLAAGATRIIASQWSVADDATAELVGSFFEEMAGELAAGREIRYSTLLKRAKQRLRSQSGASDKPYFWAGLVLIGAR